MDTIKPLARLPWVSTLIAVSLLTGCGGAGVAVAPTSSSLSSTQLQSPASPTSPPATTPVELMGTPVTSATTGQDYLFKPTVAQGGGVVTFAIQGQPAWTTFDTNTGVLTGTPATANVGTTGNITITGSNGSSSASIGPFKIVVKAPATPPPAGAGTATLTWAPPTLNTVGSTITDLTGYHIYYGTSPNSLTTTITVTDVSQTSYVVSGLAPGTYYFAVDAYNSAGVDSAESNVGTATI
jgi:hypothetical protein